MKKIEVAFRWVDLDNESKRNLVCTFAELLDGIVPSFEQLDMGLTAINCEFILRLDKGRPYFALSDQTRAVLFPQMFN